LKVGHVKIIIFNIPAQVDIFLEIQILKAFANQDFLVY